MREDVIPDLADPIAGAGVVQSFGVVEAIFVASEAASPMRAVAAARVEPGRGLEGDRYFDARGTFSAWPGTGRHVTLVAAEAIDAVERELGVTLAPGATRRNVVVRGLDLDASIGRELQVGDVVLRGMRRCEPCDHLVKLLGDSRLLRAFAGRGGLRCDVVAGGALRVGDTVRDAGTAAPACDDVACEVRATPP